MKFKHPINIIIILTTLIASGVIYWKAMNFRFNDSFGTSDSIEESKERGVFIAEYSIQPNSIIIKNDKLLRLEKAWIEQSYYYRSGSDQPLEKDDVINLILKVNPSDFGNYYNLEREYLIWYSSLRSDSGYSVLAKSSPTKLYSYHSPFSTHSPPSDTIQLSVIIGNERTVNGDTIGRMYLYRLK